MLPLTLMCKAGEDFEGRHDDATGLDVIFPGVECSRENVGDDGERGKNSNLRE